jgi:hypothetical protein
MKPAGTIRPRIACHWPIAAVMALIASIYLPWTWTDQIGTLSSDAPAYLVMARHYADGPQHLALVSVNDMAGALNRFPPLYPIALARLHAVEDLHRVHLVTTVFFLLGLLALYGWLCKAGLAAGEAALLTLLYATLPGSWLLALSPQSEFLYLLCSVLALFFLAAYEQGRRSEILYAAAVAIAAAALTRTVGITLLGPLSIVAFSAPRRNGAIALALALCPLLFWYLLHHSGQGYVESLSQYYGGNAGSLLMEQLGTEVPALRTGMVHSYVQDYAPHLSVDLLGLLFLAATAHRAAALKPDAIYLALYLFAVLVWPFDPNDAQRFLWPVLPLLMAQPVLVLSQWRNDSNSNRRLQAALAGLALATLCFTLPEIAVASERYGEAGASGIPGARGLRTWYQSSPTKAARRTAGEALVIGMLRRMGSEVPPGDCVVSIRPDLVNYFAGRLSAWPPTDAVPDPEFTRELHAAHCRYLFVTTASYSGYPVPLHPLQRLSEKISVIDYGEVPIAGPGDGRILCMLARFPQDQK